MSAFTSHTVITLYHTLKDIWQSLKVQVVYKRICQKDEPEIMFLEEYVKLDYHTTNYNYLYSGPG